MANQKLSATISIGGAVEKSFSKGLKSTRGNLAEIGSAIGEVKARQIELGKTRRVMERQGESVEDLDREYQELSETMDRLKRKQKAWQDVASKQGRVGSAFRNMVGEVGGLAARAGAAVTGLGVSVGLLTHNVATGSEEVNQFAKRLGVTTEWLSRTQYAAAQFGITNEALVDGVKELSLRADEFATNGGGGAAEAFERLGLSQREVNELSNDTAELFRVVKGRMTAITDAAARQRIADELFGGTGGEQFIEMLQLSEAELESLRREADAVGATISQTQADAAREYSRAWREVGGVFTGLKNTIGAQLIPVFSGMMRQFSGWAKENQDRIKAFATEFGARMKSALPVIGNMIQGLSNAAETIGAVTTRVAGMVGGFENLGMIIGAVFAGKAIMSVVAFTASVGQLGASLLSLAGGFPAVVAGIKAVGLALMANPIGLIVGGIAAVAGILIANWDTVGPWFADMWGKVTGFFSAAWDHIKGLLSWTPLGLVIENWGGLTDWFGGLWDGIIASAKSAFDWIAGKLEWVGNAAAKVKGWFGFGDDEGSAPESAPASAGVVAGSAITAPADVPGPSPVPVVEARQQQPVTIRKEGDSHSYTFNINGITNPEAVADAVRRMIEERQRQDERGALYDHGLAY